MRRIAQVILAMTLAFGLMAGPKAEPVGAWNGYRQFNQIDNIYYCFNPNSGWTSTTLNTLRSAIDEIDDNASGLTMTEQGPMSHSCLQPFWYANYLKITFDSTGCAIMCYIRNYNNGGLAGHEIRINPHRAMYWGSGQQNCLAGVNCMPYARGAFQHEIMHWLGFQHPGFPGANLGSCIAGYHTSWTQLKCDTYGERLMYANAADGYYRTLSWPSSDDLNGLNAWYDK